MNNQQLALLLKQYLRALDVGLDQVAQNIPEYKETVNPIPGLLLTEKEVYPVLDPVYRVYQDMESDIGNLEKSANPLLVEQDTPSKPDNPIKESITFEQSHISVNGVDLGVHDLLSYARLILRRERRDSEQKGYLVAQLEVVILSNQNVRGIEDGARMPSLE